MSDDLVLGRPSKRRTQLSSSTSGSTVSVHKKSGPIVPGRSLDQQRWTQVISQDLLAEVFSRVPFEERLRTLPVVCKTWNHVSKDPACWREVDMESWFEKKLEENLWWEFDCESKVELLVKQVVDRSGGQLLLLRTRHCSDVLLDYIMERSPLLTVLSIRNSPSVTDKSLSKLPQYCPDLQELDVSDCYNITNDALENLRQWKPHKLQIKPLVLYFFWQQMLRLYMANCKTLQS